MIVGVPRETFPGERRVALTPKSLDPVIKAGMEVRVEAAAGLAAGFRDAEYTDRGARVVTRDEVFAADVLTMVRALGANPEHGRDDLTRMREGQIVIGLCEPLTATVEGMALAEHGVTSFALELIPRITRAQSMDVLSSMASIAGYKAVLIAANALPRLFPMMTTAAGTLAPARVFVLGAGVAGLQAIATAKRLGAVVTAYDVRPAVKEQVESLGAKFVVIDLETGSSEDKGGYAKAMGEEFYKRQRDRLIQVVRESDVVITTAAVPGQKAPILLTEEMVRAMSPGSVVVDLAAERGGNCALTRAGEIVMADGVEIHGPLNVPSTVAYHASQTMARNIATFLKHLAPKGEVVIDREDEITRETLLTYQGQVVHPKVASLVAASAK